MSSSRPPKKLFLEAKKNVRKKSPHNKKHAKLTELFLEISLIMTGFNCVFPKFFIGRSTHSWPTDFVKLSSTFLG